MDSGLKFGIPNIELPWSDGGTVNPSCFVGHQLVVLFLPVGTKEQAEELTAYDKVADEFADSDTWLLTISKSAASDSLRCPNIPIALDPDGTAWQAFVKLAEAGTKLKRDNGAAFLFTRGGALCRVWPGHGHTRAVMDELLTRA